MLAKIENISNLFIDFIQYIDWSHWISCWTLLPILRKITNRAGPNSITWQRRIKWRHKFHLFISQFAISWWLHVYFTLPLTYPISACTHNMFWLCAQTKYIISHQTLYLLLMWSSMHVITEAWQCLSYVNALSNLTT